MPDVIDLFPHLASMSTVDLYARYNEVGGNDRAGVKTIEQLQELVCISRLLRSRAITSSGKAPKAKVIVTEDML